MRVFFQDLHPGAIDEDVATGGPDHCRQLAAQLVLGVLLDFHPTADTQRIDPQQCLVVVRQAHFVSTGAGAASGEVRTISSTTRSMDRRPGLFRGRARSLVEQRAVRDRLAALVALQALDMQGFQLAEEFSGGKRIEGCAGQSLAQRLEQAWHALQQLLAGQRIIMRADAPDQLVHGIQGLPPLGRSLAMLEADQQHHLAPGIPQQAHHHLRQDLAEQSLVQHLLHVLTSQFGLGAAFLGVAGALLEEPLRRRARRR